MKIAICVGTRPEIVKMAPVIRACIKNNVNFIVINSGQHYSKNMSKVFFEQLKLPKPNYNLKVGSGSHAKTTAKIIEKVENVFLKEEPDVVLVEGDTNTVLGCAIAASKMGIKVGHVEAGLRSKDMSMPEEKNRIMVDHISDYLFSPTEEAKQNLIKENIEGSKIFVVGNTIVDATLENSKLIDDVVLLNYMLEKNDYILVTSHREENVDNKERLTNIVNSLVELSKEYTIVFPVHPRTDKRINEFKLREKLRAKNIILIPAVSYNEFLALEKNARLIITDSGGVQEESCILNVPCVTIRENTERPETIKVGSNVIAGTNISSILEKTKLMINKTGGWENPFGDGKSGEKIIDLLLKVGTK